MLRRYSKLAPILNWGLFVIGGAYSVASIAGLTGYPPTEGVVAGDAYNYWQGQAYSDPDYRYSPAFYWATAPLRALPFEIFVSIWTALHLLAVAWLAPWMAVVAFDDVIRGNINVFLAVGLVVAVTGRPWAWAGMLLTKVTPGVGIAYHIGRREWGSVAIAGGTTLAIAAVTWPFGLWPEWFASLVAGTSNYETIDFLGPLPFRIALGLLLSLAAARWIWLLPLSVILAMPGLWPSTFALLAALPRLIAFSATRGKKNP